MITARSIRGGGYGSRHLIYSDYVDEEALVVGQWAGHGAAQLGLFGQVWQKHFEAVTVGADPETGEFLRQRASSRSLFDFTVSAPKSVSIMAVVGEDSRLRDAHEKAVRVALEHAEALAETRVRLGGANESRRTGNLIVGIYTHDTSRKLDPQLHSHCVAANMTFDPVESRWKALEARSIYDHIDLLTEVYRSVLAQEVVKAGYEIESIRDERGKDRGFEIVGIPEHVRAAMSQRSVDRDQAIDQFMKDRGRNPTNREIAVLVRESREDKLQEIATAEVRALQKDRLGQIALSAIERLRDRAFNRTPWRAAKHISAKQALDHARDHVFERVTVATEKDLVTEALRFGRGSVGGGAGLLAIRHELKQGIEDGTFLSLGSQITTKENLLREQEMIANINRGSGSFPSLGSTPLPAAGFVIREIRFAVKAEQSEEQSGVIQSVLGSRDRVTAIQGAAGTGKSKVLVEIKQGIELGGGQVEAVAPTASAVGELKKLGFEKAVTLEAYLSRPRTEESKRESRGVLLVDEAGMIGTKNMSQLLELTEKTDTRVLLVGDTKQLKSVDAGDAFRVLAEQSKLQVAKLKEVFRQKGAYERAISKLRDDPVEGFRALEKMGAIKEVPVKDRAAIVADAYAKHSEKYKSVLVVAPTWSEIGKLTEAIREKRKADQTIKGERPLTRLKNLAWTEAEKRNFANYQTGQTLVFHKETRQFGKHEQARVLSVTSSVLGSKLLVEKGNGRQAWVSKKQAKCFGVFAEERIHVGEGDKLLLQENRAGRPSRNVRERLENALVRVVEPDLLFRGHNGEIVTVKGFDSSGRICLEDGRKLPKDYRQFTHGYAVTVHASQGKTVDSVIVSGDRMSREHFYVAASRGRHELAVFTSGKTGFRNSIIESEERLAAVELADRVSKARAWAEERAKQDHSTRENQALSQSRGGQSRGLA